LGNAIAKLYRHSSASSVTCEAAIRAVGGLGGKVLDRIDVDLVDPVKGDGTGLD
jgi:hypothetical protein